MLNRTAATVSGRSEPKLQRGVVDGQCRIFHLRQQPRGSRAGEVLRRGVQYGDFGTEVGNLGEEVPREQHRVGHRPADEATPERIVFIADGVKPPHPLRLQSEDRLRQGPGIAADRRTGRVLAGGREDCAGKGAAERAGCFWMQVRLLRMYLPERPGNTISLKSFGQTQSLSILMIRRHDYGSL